MKLFWRKPKSLNAAYLCHICVVCCLVILNLNLLHATVSPKFTKCSFIASNGERGAHFVCAHTLKIAVCFNSRYVLSHSPQTTLRFRPNWWNLWGYFIVHGAPPLSLCASLLLQLSTFQMIIHMSAQFLCWPTCVHWPWIGVPFPQLIN